MSEKKNTKPLSMRRIKKLKALCRAATPAPWKDIRHSIQSEDGYEIGRTYRVESQKDTICHLDSYLGYPENEKADAAFIAAARQAIPDLLADVERLNREADWLAEHLHRAGIPCPGDGEKFDPYGECAEKGWPCVACFREWARQQAQGEKSDGQAKGN